MTQPSSASPTWSSSLSASTPMSQFPSAPALSQMPTAIDFDPSSLALIPGASNPFASDQESVNDPELQQPPLHLSARLSRDRRTKRNASEVKRRSELKARFDDLGLETACGPNAGRFTIVATAIDVIRRLRQERDDLRRMLQLSQPIANVSTAVDSAPTSTSTLAPFLAPFQPSDNSNRFKQEFPALQSLVPIGFPPASTAHFTQDVAMAYPQQRNNSRPRLSDASSSTSRSPSHNFASGMDPSFSSSPGGRAYIAATAPLSRAPSPLTHLSPRSDSSSSGSGSSNSNSGVLSSSTSVPLQLSSSYSSSAVAASLGAGSFSAPQSSSTLIQQPQEQQQQSSPSSVTSISSLSIRLNACSALPLPACVCTIDGLQILWLNQLMTDFVGCHRNQSLFHFIPANEAENLALRLLQQQLTFPDRSTAWIVEGDIRFHSTTAPTARNTASTMRFAHVAFVHQHCINPHDNATTSLVFIVCTPSSPPSPPPSNAPTRAGDLASTTQQASPSNSSSPRQSYRSSISQFPLGSSSASQHSPESFYVSSSSSPRH